MSSKRELILIGRWVLPSAWYINLNKYVMSVIFFVPLSSESDTIFSVLCNR